MHTILIIAKRELQVFFDSLIAYVILTIFLTVSGLFTWLFGSDIFLVGQANLRAFFSIASITLFFFIPAITMKMFAEEKNTGTLELLLTKAISDRDLVIGKFLGSLGLVCIALAATLPYAITIANIGDLDNGGTICGYLALLLMSVAYTAVGVFSSSVTTNQIVAFIMSLTICFVIHFVFDFLGAQFTGFVGQLISSFSLRMHFDSMSRGVIDSQDVVYFLSITVLGLFLTEQSLAKRHSSN